MRIKLVASNAIPNITAVQAGIEEAFGFLANYLAPRTMLTFTLSGFKDIQLSIEFSSNGRRIKEKVKGALTMRLILELAQRVEQKVFALFAKRTHIFPLQEVYPRLSYNEALQSMRELKCIRFFFFNADANGKLTVLERDLAGSVYTAS